MKLNISGFERDVMEFMICWQYCSCDMNRGWREKVHTEQWVQTEKSHISVTDGTKGIRHKKEKKIL